MRKAVGVIFLACLFTALPLWAQQKAIRLDHVRRLAVASTHYPTPLVASLEKRLGQMEHLEIVPYRDAADATLVLGHGCDPLTLERVPQEEEGSWLCWVIVVDDHLKSTKPGDEVVAAMPAYRVAAAVAESTTLQEVTDAIFEWFMKEWKIASLGRSLRLEEVRTIYVPKAMRDPRHANQPVDMMRAWLFQKLAKPRKAPKGTGVKREYVGDCVSGFESVLEGVRLVCEWNEADAVLVSSSDTGETRGEVYGRVDPDMSGMGNDRVWGQIRIHQDTIGGAALYDRHSGEPIWSAGTSDAAHPALEAFLGISGGGGAPKVAEKLAKQLKKDWEKARKRGEQGGVK